MNLTAVVVDYEQQTALAGLDVSYCITTNQNCAGTVPKAVPVPNMGPVVNIQIPWGSEGFLRQTAVDHFPQDYYLLAPMLANDASLVPSAANPKAAFTLVANTALMGFLGDLGAAASPELGILAVFIVDCNGNRVPGARLRLTEERPELKTATYWAINNLLPTRDVLTDADGIAGFVNVPTGSVQIEATIGDFPFGRIRFRVLGGRITAATIRPWYITGQ